MTEATAGVGDEAKRAFDAMMAMKKIDVAASKVWDRDRVSRSDALRGGQALCGARPSARGW
jgi:hypothetical protein